MGWVLAFGGFALFVVGDDGGGGGGGGGGAEGSCFFLTCVWCFRKRNGEGPYSDVVGLFEHG